MGGFFETYVDPLKDIIQKTTGERIKSYSGHSIISSAYNMLKAV